MKKIIAGAALCAFGQIQADLPTAATIQKNMGLGYNIGNTMEVVVGSGCNDVTCWGNIYPTQTYLDSIKAAGFSTVRIPCAWDSHASNNVIRDSWMDSVQTVVDYAINDGLYIVLNIHWDGGWLQDGSFDAVDASVTAKQKAYWTQIATRFKNYDEHLLFSGMNEPGLNITWSESKIPALVSYQQTFIDAVRATGGNNATRTLIVSGPKTDIDVTNSYYTTMPTDNVSGRLMVEVHYYDPYQYTLMTEEQNWGATENILPQYYYGDYLSTSEIKRNAGYNAWALSVDSKLASITHANEQFAKMKTQFIDKGYPVIIGEFGANLHTDALSGSALTQHKKGRVQWHKDVATAAKNYGLTPILWDMGNESSTLDNMTYIRHSTKDASTAGKVVDVDVINALRSVYGLGTYVNNGVSHTSSSSAAVSSSSVSSSSTLSSSSYSTQSSSSECNGITDNCWRPGSSSSSYAYADCDALIPECGYTEDALCNMGITQYCATTGIGKSAKVVTSIIREGSNLTVQGAQSPIHLFDMNGNLIRRANAESNRSTMNLDGLKCGMYIAKCGNSVLKVNVK